MEYCADLDIGIEYILKDSDYFSKLPITDEAPAHFIIPKDIISDEFYSWLTSNNLELEHSELFYCQPKGNIFMHIDEIDPPDSCKLNWVYDQGETLMRWYKLKEHKELQLLKSPIGTNYWSADRKDCTLAYQYRVGKPTLINAGEIHDVINPSNHRRFCVSIVVKVIGEDVRVGYSRLKDLLKDYVLPTTVGV
jgi:hypothetical protein